MIRLFAALILMVPSLVFGQAAASTADPMPPEKALGLCQKYAADYLAGNLAALWPKMSIKMHDALKSETEAKARFNAAMDQIGRETRVENERVLPLLATDNMIYTRLAEFEKVPVKLVTTIVVDPGGTITGLSIRPTSNPAESKYLDYKPKATLAFPLHGEWTIYQGGRSVYDNYHSAYAIQRFAYDILRIHPDGRAASGDGSKPEQYFGFGQPVFAAAAGKVVSAVDQYDDNPINKPLKDSPKEGNNVVIDHGNGEFSMYAHLKRGTVKVKTGDEVKPGQQIAEVGNSGNSPVPHLHYHMQDTPDWVKGEGLPTPFQKLTVNGKAVAMAEPVRGDVVKAE